MSECIIITEPQGAFCHRHHCFLTQVDELCSVARLTSEVERLIAELERVTAREIAADDAMRDEAEKRKDRDRRIEAALEALDVFPTDRHWRVSQAVQALRGES